jgi:RimJ/RimL family protein N-acetyltransferase
MSFDYQPVLKGELVELRPLHVEDFEALYAVAADPLIWEQHPAVSRYEEAIFRAFFHEALASGGTLIAIDVDSRRVIGSSRFHGYDRWCSRWDEARRERPGQLSVPNHRCKCATVTG